MAEISFWWNTSDPPVGDGKVSYTQADLSTIAAVLAACCGWEGVAPAHLNELVPAAAGFENVNIGTGGALVDGKPYQNNVLLPVNIPSSSVNPRIDRIVLRATWGVTQTVRIFRIAGVEGSPTPPDIAPPDPGVLYDIHICQVTVDAGGNVTVTDERDWAATNANGLQANAVTTVKVQDAVITGDKIANDAVIDTKLRDSGALSVIGRAANSAGNPGDIVAGANDRFLARVGNALSWVQLAIGMIPDALITGAKMVANAIGNAQFRQSGALSVVGRAANSVGNVADIGPAPAQSVLRRSGDTLSFGTVTAVGIADNAVETAKIKDLNVTTGKIAANAVDDTKVGDRVPQFYRRQGGHATAWGTPGTTDYTPGAVRMQGGASSVTFNNSEYSNEVSITFPVAFGSAPLAVSAKCVVLLPGGPPLWGSISALSATGFTFRGGCLSPLTATVNVHWLVVGPEA